MFTTSDKQEQLYYWWRATWIHKIVLSSPCHSLLGTSWLTLAATPFLHQLHIWQTLRYKQNMRQSISCCFDNFQKYELLLNFIEDLWVPPNPANLCQHGLWFRCSCSHELKRVIIFISNMNLSEGSEKQGGNWLCYF